MGNSECYRRIQEPLLRWYERHARTLPWREHPSAYNVWVSEIMLQQTRVEAVRPFYTRFIEALPDVASLAACPEDQLLKLWEGLGYYRRVENMQKAAQIVMEKYGGTMPVTYQELCALPGIGSYTAGAIASIAGGQAVPAVDGNVLRVLSRITENGGDITRQAAKREAEEALLPIMPKECPGTFNQALMELGATVCVPNKEPDCGHCPVACLCLANLDGRQEEFPVRSRKKPRRVEDRTVLVIRDSSHAALRRRPEKGLLAGLYELPNLEGHLKQEEVLAQVVSMGFSPIRIQSLPPAKHIFTHVEWHMIGYFVLVEDQDTLGEQSSADAILFLTPESISEKYAVPAAFSAYKSSLLTPQRRDRLKRQVEETG